MIYSTTHVDKRSQILNNGNINIFILKVDYSQRRNPGLLVFFGHIGLVPNLGSKD